MMESKGSLDLQMRKKRVFWNLLYLLNLPMNSESVYAKSTQASFECSKEDIAICEIHNTLWFVL